MEVEEVGAARKTLSGRWRPGCGRPGCRRPVGSTRRGIARVGSMFTAGNGLPPDRGVAAVGCRGCRVSRVATRTDLPSAMVLVDEQGKFPCTQQLRPSLPATPEARRRSQFLGSLLRLTQ